MSWLMFSLAASSLWPRGLPKINGLNLALISRNYTTKMSSDSHWLPPADRDQHVMELRAAGWMEVEDRDAIFKELHFKTFNQAAVAVGAPHPVLCDNHAVIAAKWQIGGGRGRSTGVVLIIGGIRLHVARGAAGREDEPSS
ncbi:uncharacterized protein ACBT44_022685 isoform 1-T1 [Syngnathus typhle]